MPTAKTPPKLSGLIQVYTGEGKGKTTAALGQALRARGRGLRVKIYQFLKPPHSSGEHFAATLLDPGLEIVPLGRKGFLTRRGVQKEDSELAKAGLDQARRAMTEGLVDLLVLDEINVALSLGVLDLDDVLAFLDDRPPSVEVILTGRGAPREVLARADLVTEMKPVKHPYKQGIKAREGIEF